MAKGYAEGSALEEKIHDVERAKRGGGIKPSEQRLAVFGSTTAKRFARRRCTPRW